MTLKKYQTQLQLFHTEKREKVPFTSRDSEPVTIYTCGPTVYDFAHIGNFRTYVFEDLLRRTLKLFGYKVIQVMNITDVDDKTIRNALVKGVTLNEYVEPYIRAFFDDLKELHIEEVEFNPKATDYIPHMILFIQKLMEKGYAYQGSDQSVYFSIKKNPHYGKLCHLNLDSLKEGGHEGRVNNDEYDKENAGDFVLWKAHDPERDGEIFWESPFGKGRPGWHLECSTMAMKILGDTIDIHMGAVDNIFPHHENEIAQSECLSGKTFSRYWVHSEHLIVEGKKMSKSLGNFYTLRDLMSKGYHGKEVRFLLLQTHYKTQLNFTFDALEAAKIGLKRIQTCVERLLEKAGEGETLEEVKQLADHALDAFCLALADDLNTSKAVATLFDLMPEINKRELSSGDAQYLLDLFKRFDSVLGVMEFKAAVEEVPQALQEMLAKRMEARAQKNWALADELRDAIQAKGYVIEDRPGGTAKLVKTIVL
jgi:cysteinyl-tRNA synthetase